MSSLLVVFPICRYRHANYRAGGRAPLGIIRENGILQTILKVYFLRAVVSASQQLWSGIYNNL
jgi:hypothetical protein